MTRYEADRATWLILDATKDLERGIVEAAEAQDALLISTRIQQVLVVLQTADLQAHNRADALCGVKARAS
jgi:hypothetical protein